MAGWTSMPPIGSSKYAVGKRPERGLPEGLGATAKLLDHLKFENVSTENGLDVPNVNDQYGGKMNDIPMLTNIRNMEEEVDGGGTGLSVEKSLEPAQNIEKLPVTRTGKKKRKKKRGGNENVQNRTASNQQTETEGHHRSLTTSTRANQLISRKTGKVGVGKRSHGGINLSPIDRRQPVSTANQGLQSNASSPSTIQSMQSQPLSNDMTSGVHALQTPNGIETKDEISSAVDGGADGGHPSLMPQESHTINIVTRNSSVFEEQYKKKEEELKRRLTLLQAERHQFEQDASKLIQAKQVFLRKQQELREVTKKQEKSWSKGNQALQKRERKLQELELQAQNVLRMTHNERAEMEGNVVRREQAVAEKESNLRQREDILRENMERLHHARDVLVAREQSVKDQEISLSQREKRVDHQEQRAKKILAAFQNLQAMDQPQFNTGVSYASPMEEILATGLPGLPQNYGEQLLAEENNTAGGHWNQPKGSEGRQRERGRSGARGAGQSTDRSQVRGQRALKHKHRNR